MSKPSDLVQGTLDMLLLKILALEPLNGFAVSQRLKQVSGDILQVSDGSLYPALHKLEQEGWISAEWKTTDNNRRAKYYSLTRLGRRQLEKEAENYPRFAGLTLDASGAYSTFFEAPKLEGEFGAWLMRGDEPGRSLYPFFEKTAGATPPPERSTSG